jgi:serine/threonine protein kinase
MNPGNLLRNRYRIEKALAIGGFGETYLAIDLDYPSQRRVVVKQLKPAQSDPATLAIARRLFESEAQVLADLGETSDRLPALYACFEEQGEFYLVQEFIAGQTLTIDLAGRRLSESQTVEILREILAGLQVVHGKNKIHRDLKPDNIMRRTQDGKLVLIDFGAVKEVRQATNLGKKSASIGIGTLGYMPTEQAIGFPRLASDVYAVGAIGIQCLTGEEPHKLFDEDALVLRWQHLCRVSSGLAAVLEKMVAQQVSGRYQDGMEAAKAIEKLSIASAASTVIPKPLPIETPVVIQTPALAANLLDFGRHKFLKFVMIGGTGLFGVFLLVNIFIPQTPVINNSSTDVASLPSSTTTPAIINNGSNDTNNHSNRSLSKSELENKNKEIAIYDKAISINSQDINTYIRRGNAKFALGNSQAAIADYNKAISLDPQYARAYNNRGNAKFKLGNNQAAIADYNKAISLDPQYARAYNNRGNAKFKLGNNQAAIADYNKAISLDPQDVSAYNNRGNIKFKLGNKQEAIADFNKAISLDPENARAYNSRGIVKHKLGNSQAAIADYNKAISLDPQDARFHSNRGNVKFKLGNKQEAIADYKQAAELHRQQGDLHEYQEEIELIKSMRL